MTSLDAVMGFSRSGCYADGDITAIESFRCRNAVLAMLEARLSLLIWPAAIEQAPQKAR